MALASVSFSYNSHNQTNKYPWADSAGQSQKTPFSGNDFAKKTGVKSTAPNSKSATNQSSEDSYVGNPELKNLIRALNAKGPEDGGTYNFNKKFTATSKDKVNGFLQIAGASIDKELESIKSKPKYNYQQIAAKITQAKNSISAGKALLSAKRSVREIRGKLAKSKGSEAEELQLALSHAKRMEMVARKKKHHLELEEMVEHQSSLDERSDEMESAAQDLRLAMTQEAEEEVSKAEDAIFEEKEEMMEEYSEAYEDGAEISEEAMEELNAMIADFGEEELKQLEEAMEMLENMEVLDPHMSEEDLEKLKQKHRASEQKAITKANADYLKGMIKHLEKSGSSMPQIQTAPQVTTVAVHVDVPVPAPSLDISL